MFRTREGAQSGLRALHGCVTHPLGSGVALDAAMMTHVQGYRNYNAALLGQATVTKGQVRAIECV